MTITPLHVAILEWVHTRPSAPHARPVIPEATLIQIDGAVAELVMWELVTAVVVPRRPGDRGHWEPTGLTPRGEQTLAQHREPEEAPRQPWWKRLVPTRVAL